MAKEVGTSTDPWAEINKELVLGSIKRGLDFHKTMLTVSSTFETLMTTVFGLVTINIKQTVSTEAAGSIVERTVETASVPALVVMFFGLSILAMLVSAICYAMGYLPRRSSTVLEGKPVTVLMLQLTRGVPLESAPAMPEDIISEASEYRHKWAVRGTGFFAAALLLGVSGILWSIL